MLTRFIENPSSCHSVNFKYSISGENPGALRLWLQGMDGDNLKELWSVSDTTLGWTEARVVFRYFDRFKVRSIMSRTVVHRPGNSCATKCISSFDYIPFMTWEQNQNVFAVCHTQTYLICSWCLRQRDWTLLVEVTLHWMILSCPSLGVKMFLFIPHHRIAQL